MLLFILVLICPSLTAATPTCQERFLEFEYDASWVPPEEPYFKEEELGADWPGKREHAFYDTLTR